jgi:predicted nucleic acid-binding protein
MIHAKVIVDTSVIIKWLSVDKEEYLDQANQLLEKALDEKVELFAPELSKYEVGNTLFFSKKLSSEQAAVVLKQFYTLPITFVTESEELARETYNLAFKYSITYYDATFMSLAKQYHATLITDNIKHQGKATDITVKSLAEY